jgi:hypothetical protein
MPLNEEPVEAEVVLNLHLEKRLLLALFCIKSQAGFLELKKQIIGQEEQTITQHE